MIVCPYRKENGKALQCPQDENKSMDPTKHQKVCLYNARCIFPPSDKDGNESV